MATSDCTQVGVHELIQQPLEDAICQWLQVGGCDTNSLPQPLNTEKHDAMSYRTPRGFVRSCTHELSLQLFMCSVQKPDIRCHITCSNRMCALQGLHQPGL